MAKAGEISYLSNIGPCGIAHAVGKPFSDAECSKYLFEIGAVFTLLPPPPARLLDIGCGTGWTSKFFARRGYTVLGIDIAPDMIRHAAESAELEDVPNCSFRTFDYEECPFDREFDCAVFFDSLHHAVDEQAAVNMAFRALKPGGVCVTSEPGTGHAAQPGSIAAMDKFGVTEKDMPPHRIIAIGRVAGFKDFRVVPHAFDVNVAVFAEALNISGDAGNAKEFRQKAAINFAFLLSVLDHSGIVRMVKG